MAFGGLNKFCRLFFSENIRILPSVSVDFVLPEVAFPCKELMLRENFEA